MPSACRICKYSVQSCASTLGRAHAKRVGHVARVAQRGAALRYHILWRTLEQLVLPGSKNDS